MGNIFSNRKQYYDNPKFVVCNAAELRRRFCKHNDNARIISIMKIYPIATNYYYNPYTRIAEISVFENFHRPRFPLWFHIATLRFCLGCKIVLTKELYSKIIELDKLDPIPLSEDDKIKIREWTADYNFFI